MKPVLFYDTETTGLPLFREPSDDPRQPHIVQLGACLVNLATRHVISSIDVICRPDGWVIPDDVAKIHGITTEYAQAVGVPESLAVEMLLDMSLQAGIRIGHNENFDARIVRIACKRFFDEDSAELWEQRARACTAQLSTPILALPPTEKMLRAGFTKHKTPNLGEAFKHFTGRDLEGAHSAMVDVRACMEVFFAIQDLPASKAAA